MRHLTKIMPSQELAVSDGGKPVHEASSEERRTQQNATLEVVRCPYCVQGENLKAMLDDRRNTHLSFRARRDAEKAASSAGPSFGTRTGRFNSLLVEKIHRSAKIESLPSTAKAAAINHPTSSPTPKEQAGSIKVFRRLRSLGNICRHGRRSYFASDALIQFPEGET